MASVRADLKKRVLREPTIIILDDLDTSFTQNQIDLAIDLWNRGIHIDDMARLIRKYDKLLDAIDEITLLIIHLKRQGLINNREEKNAAAEQQSTS